MFSKPNYKHNNIFKNLYLYKSNQYLNNYKSIQIWLYFLEKKKIANIPLESTIYTFWKRNLKT